MSPRFGPFNLPPESEQVVDADEEIFLLYTDLQSFSQSVESGSTTPFRGLGHIDSFKDFLTVFFELHKQPLPSQTPYNSKSRKESRKTRKAEKGTRNPKPLELEVMIYQDKTALRSRKGDTGSVLWHASVDFAKLVLQQVHFSDHTMTPFVDGEELKTCHILELGAGTGLLGVVLSPLARKYTVTDIDDLVPLIQKNIQLNIPRWPHDTNITISPLDWLVLQQASSTKRRELYAFDPIDVLLIVDCIYHPSLLPSLLETINFLIVPGRTTILVVVELRAPDVVREFLQLWIAMSDWEVWRVADNGKLLGRPYAMWAGMKRSTSL
ncbi:hypothetical protein E1B28_007182 [Marasmius oreades]|uniref:Methyltransferase-domain-containing protein n=1 Tax=Marasmius oreades TaxID=181124 RepID=A0A9P7S1B3_9AGAR|nr:uncharacterized protein E1B28_007182 [Marasmius oreades]KAG7093507.1 hypothetical protein E1B28_007182 [Marasmius oreades]